MKKRLIAGLAVGGITFGGVFAFAATMGLTSDSLGSNEVAVENTCDAAISFTDLSYDDTTSAYEVDEVTVTPTHASCAGKTFEVTLANGATALFESDPEAFVDGTTGIEVTVDDGVEAEDVNDAYVVVTDTP